MKRFNRVINQSQRKSQGNSQNLLSPETKYILTNSYYNGINQSPRILAFFFLYKHEIYADEA